MNRAGVVKGRHRYTILALFTAVLLLLLLDVGMERSAAPLVVARDLGTVAQKPTKGDVPLVLADVDDLITVARTPREARASAADSGSKLWSDLIAPVDRVRDEGVGEAAVWLIARDGGRRRVPLEHAVDGTVFGGDHVAVLELEHHLPRLFLPTSLDLDAREPVHARLVPTAVIRFELAEGASVDAPSFDVEFETTRLMSDWGMAFVVDDPLDRSSVTAEARNLEEACPALARRLVADDYDAVFGAAEVRRLLTIPTLERVLALERPATREPFPTERIEDVVALPTEFRLPETDDVWIKVRCVPDPSQDLLLHFSAIDICTQLSPGHPLVVEVRPVHSARVRGQVSSSVRRASGMLRVGVEENSHFFEYEFTADENGSFVVERCFPGNGELYVGWHHLDGAQGYATRTFELRPGEDLDLGCLDGPQTMGYGAVRITPFVMLDGVASDLDVDVLLRRTTYSITVAPIGIDAVEAEERTREVLAWARLPCVVDDLAPGRYRVTVDSLNLDSALRDTHRVIDFNVSEEVVVGAQTPEVVVPVALETSVKCIVRMEVPFPERNIAQKVRVHALALERSPQVSLSLQSCWMGPSRVENRSREYEIETHLPPGRWALVASVQTEPHGDRDGTYPHLQGYVGRVEVEVELVGPLEVFVPLELASSIFAPAGLFPAGAPGRTELRALPVDMPPSMAELWQWTRAKDGTYQVMGLLPSTEYRVPGTELVLVSGPAGTTVTLER